MLMMGATNSAVMLPGSLMAIAGMGVGLVILACVMLFVIARRAREDARAPKGKATKPAPAAKVNVDAKIADEAFAARLQRIQGTRA